MSYRSIGLLGLRRVIRDLRRDWNTGKQSGYPSCCRVWFSIRAAVLHLTYIVFNRAPLFATQKKMKAKRIHSHIGCPYHERFTPVKDIKYFQCSECGWQQYQQQVCNRCGEKCDIM